MDLKALLWKALLAVIGEFAVTVMHRLSNTKGCYPRGAAIRQFEHLSKILKPVRCAT
jgi:hypothetical protein